MKKISSYFILLLAAAVMVSCSGLNKMKKNANLVKYEVTPKVLETHAGLVEVTIKGSYPQKYFDKKTVLEITPVLTYEGGETAFDKVSKQGESIKENNQSISNASGGTFTYNGKIPYKDAMKMSQLVVRVKATRGKTVLAFDPVKIADGVIATSTLVMVDARPIMMADKYVRITPESQMADIKYQINMADIRSTELTKDDVKLLKDYIKSVSADSTRKFKTAEISSYASPDGPYTLNEKLSGKRGETADKFIKKEFDKVPAAKTTGFFNSKTTAEDWDGFKAELEKSNVQDKDLILRVLSMYSDPEVRNKEIKNMSAAFEVLKKDILPQLRRSKFMLSVDKVGRSDEQILAQIKADPKVLSLEELLYAATLTKDFNEKLNYYQIASAQNPTCIRAANNIGYCYLELGKADEAIAALEKAKAIANSDIVKNNFGFAYLLKGDAAKAEEYFTSMTTATPESKYGLGILAIKKGQYDQAVNYFGSEPSYNLALALLLKGDVNKAKVTLESLKELCKCGMPSYLKAVVGARMDDRTYAFNNLREAIGLKADWKAYAKTDLEFAKYFNDDTFKGIIQ
ncbi:MAG: tetratricopeptide repeat protein [Bacteroidales bacterium]|jgi:Flp pilus assembly protein TadD/PBP1b-binding outer membrane lipoprotein LpoB